MCINWCKCGQLNAEAALNFSVKSRDQLRSGLQYIAVSRLGYFNFSHPVQSVNSRLKEASITALLCGIIIALFVVPIAVT